MLISGHCSAWVLGIRGWWLGWNTCPSPNLVITPWLTACSGVVFHLRIWRLLPTIKISQCICKSLFVYRFLVKFASSPCLCLRCLQRWAPLAWLVLVLVAGVPPRTLDRFSSTSTSHTHTQQQWCQWWGNMTRQGAGHQPPRGHMATLWPSSEQLLLTITQHQDSGGCANSCSCRLVSYLQYLQYLYYL